MDKKKTTFTNEELSKKFKNNFDLVNYAISLAENMIHSGRETRVKSELQNRAMLILEEIQEGQDQIDEIEEIRVEGSFDNEKLQPAEIISEQKLERRRYKTALIVGDEEEEE